MFRRYAAGTSIASIAIALAGTVLLLTPRLTFQRIYPLTLTWCVVPMAWGIGLCLRPQGGYLRSSHFGDQFWD